MKPILIAALLVGFFVPSYGQQQLCFSKNCPQTPATIFTLDRSIPQLNTIFRPLPSLPAYKPVAPLALSPSTRQFFQYWAPTNIGHQLEPTRPGGATAQTETSHGDTTGTHSPAGVSSSHTPGATFSTGRGGIAFTPTSPKL